MQPIPKAPAAPSAANAIPAQGRLSPRSSTYMAPPSISPVPLRTRYRTARSVSAYRVAIPKRPLSHIHSTAPGPPRATAVPTPMMFPVPTEALRAVARAAKGLTSPAASGSRDNDSRMP